MTINKYLQQISPEDLAYVKRYHHEIQPFRVLPSSTLEFDGQFNGGGETIFTEIEFCLQMTDNTCLASTWISRNKYNFFVCFS